MRNRIVVLAISLAVCGAFGFALVFSGPSGAARVHGSPSDAFAATRALFSSGAQASSPRASQAVVRHFSVLRSARAASAEGLPAVFDNLAAQSPGLGLDTSRVGFTSPSRSVKVWLVPGSAGTCIAVEGPGGADDYTTACGANSGPNPVAQNGIWFTEGDGTTETLVGLVPDGNATVTVNKWDGTSITVPAAHNVFSASTPSSDRFTGYELRTGAGSPAAVVRVAGGRP